MRKILPSILLFIVITSKAQTPQEFLHPKVWLRADQFDEKNNYWNDVSGNNYHAQPSDSFSLSTNGLINFNRAINFDGIDDKFEIPYNVSHSTQLTIISVYHSDDSTLERGIWNTQINTDQHVMLSTQRTKGPQSIVKYSEGNMDFPLINTLSQFWGESDGTLLNNKISLGSGGPEELEIKPFSGGIAEFIVFDRLISDLEFKIIQSYLSIKYGAPLIYSDYITTKGEIIWNFENNKEYSNSITGIGRDDGLSLYQKQSFHSGEPDFLVIGLGEIAESNENNPSLLNKYEFLLWGDNGKELKLEEVPDEIYPYKLPVLDRKWLMSAIGNFASDLSTQLKLDVKNLLGDPPKCYLVIDRSGIGDFSSPNIEYIPANEITNDGYAYFNNIKWDTDKSGKDIFTFSFGMDNGVKSYNPNCFNESTGSISIEVQGGVSPYNFLLKNDSIEYEYKWSSDQRKQLVDNLSSGTYKLYVGDADGKIANDIIYINNPEKLSLGLKSNYSIKLGENIEVSPEINLNDTTLSFVWKNEKGFYSIDRNVILYETGDYSVTVSNSVGCEATEEFTVTAAANEFYNYKLYPNPTDGSFNLNISLAEISYISIRIFDTQGRLIADKYVKGTSNYRYNGYLNQQGIYLIEIETSYGKESFKLIVK